MSLSHESINSLSDLCRFRSAPSLNASQKEHLEKELRKYMGRVDWFTIGIMAYSSISAISALREIEIAFAWSPMKIVSPSLKKGPVFLKANQKTGESYLRNELGLGEGILLSCQNNNPIIDTETFGPFPLNFFKEKDQKL